MCLRVRAASRVTLYQMTAAQQNAKPSATHTGRDAAQDQLTDAEQGAVDEAASSDPVYQVDP